MCFLEENDKKMIKKIKFWKIWECTLNEITEYAFFRSV